MPLKRYQERVVREVKTFLEALEQFRFQVLDEGDYGDRDWRDELKRQLTQAVSGFGNAPG